MIGEVLQDAVSRVPAGRWAVGVSGGADSVALLRVLAARGDLTLVVAHLNHQTRGVESDADEAFVVALCRALGLACQVARREEIEPRLVDPPANRSALYRVCRRRHFEIVVERHDLCGVILAHHADDQAETVLHRLLRGSGWSNLGGMGRDSRIGAMRVLRPLLEVGREQLRAWLRSIGQGWREDASNASAAYARNRHRRALARHPALAPALLEMAEAMSGLRAWSRGHSGQFDGPIRLAELARWPAILQGESLKRWLLAAGAPPQSLERAVIDRLRRMAADAATPARQQFPGRLSIPPPPRDAAHRARRAMIRRHGRAPGA
jgi:tRNA(Ile)-lysidine synthetase-like protein